MINNNEAYSPSGSKRRSAIGAEAKRAHVEAFKKSHQTMSDYCRSHHLATSTFSKWVSKYGVNVPSSFVPIQVNSESQAQIAPTKQKATQTYSIEDYRGDLKITLPVMSDSQVTIEMIKGILACN